MQIANLRYADAGGLRIDMDVTLDTGETIPFTYDASDHAPVSTAVRALLAGGTYQIAAYAAPAFDPAAYAADGRWRKETGGITVGGAPIATDRESQSMLAGAHAYVQANPAAVIQWKTEAGFVPLDAEQITGLALAVGTHVQACFAKEAEITAAIQAGTVTTAEQIDAAYAAVPTTY